MKKLISLFGLLLIISTTMFTSCAPEAKPDNGTSDPIEKPSDTEKPELVTKEFTQQDFVIEPTSNPAWAYVQYSLSEFTGKDVTIDFSADMKVEGTKDCVLKWQVNRAPDYPVVAEYSFTSLDSDWIKVSGKNQEPINVENSFVLYLSSHEVPSADVKISVKNIKYTVTYGGSAAEEEPEVPAKEYPTDIFTVGEAGTCGLQLGDGELKPFEVYSNGSVATDIKVNDDGSVEWIASAAGGAGGGAALYLNGEDGTIDLANYESIDVEFVYSPITGSWNPKAKNPSFAVRILPWDATGIFGGAEDLIYFETNEEGYGTYKGKFEITGDFVNKIKNSADFDAVKAFTLKFNDYERGNSDGDRVKVQLKTVKFNKKAGAPADKVFDDGLDEADYGTVQSIFYPTQDYTVTENAPKYEKHGWVYLPAGYDANDKDTKYPVFILLHGFGQNENSWGLSDQGNGGKIKGYMDRRMKSGEAEKFILVCVTGVASQNWGSGKGGNGKGEDFNGFNAFGEELRNDLLPYIRENYNVKEGRDNVALAGLSMGGGQTMNIGIGQSLDLISYFGAFSAAIFNSAEEYIPSVEKAFPDLDINYLYMICGDADNRVIDGVRGVVNYIETNGWDKLGEKGKERFTYVEVPGGTHDFPVWYQGFKEYITYIFK